LDRASVEGIGVILGTFSQLSPALLVSTFRFSVFRPPSSALDFPSSDGLRQAADNRNRKAHRKTEVGGRKSEVGNESERGKRRAEVAGGARASPQELEPFCLFLAV
jgi:hypothetical protein